MDRPQPILGQDCFNSEWRKVTVVNECSIVDVNHLIMAHYLHKRPAIILLSMAMVVDYDIVGTVIYSAPPIQTSKRYGGITWELSRLYITDAIPRNAESYLISKSIKHIKRVYHNVEYLVSYADPSENHAGIIYRASNWIYDGMTDSGRKTARCDYIDIKTQKKYGRRGNVPVGAEIERIPRVSKHRYYYPMNR